MYDQIRHASDGFRNFSKGFFFIWECGCGGLDPEIWKKGVQPDHFALIMRKIKIDNFFNQKGRVSNL